MSVASKREDNRSSTRLAIAPELRKSYLIIHGEPHDVEVIDQSAGGFALRGTPRLHLSRGDEVILVTFAGKHKVLICNVRPDHENDGMLLFGAKNLGDICDEKVRGSMKGLLVSHRTSVGQGFAGPIVLAFILGSLVIFSIAIYNGAFPALTKWLGY